MGRRAWTDEEKAMLDDETLSSQEVADRTGRTLDAVQVARSRRRLARGERRRLGPGEGHGRVPARETVGTCTGCEAEDVELYLGFCASCNEADFDYWKERFG